MVLASDHFTLCLSWQWGQTGKRTWGIFQKNLAALELTSPVFSLCSNVQGHTWMDFRKDVLLGWQPYSVSYLLQVTWCSSLPCRLNNPQGEVTSLNLGFSYKGKGNVWRTCLFLNQSLSSSTFLSALSSNRRHLPFQLQGEIHQSSLHISPKTMILLCCRLSPD